MSLSHKVTGLHVKIVRPLIPARRAAGLDATAGRPSNASERRLNRRLVRARPSGPALNSLSPHDADLCRAYDGVRGEVAGHVERYADVHVVARSRRELRGAIDRHR